MAVPAPGRLLDKVAARWTRVPGPAGDVYVATTDLGVAYLRTAGTAEEFAGLFRARFGRPLLPASRPPAGLLTALRTGRAGRVPLDLRDLTPFAASVLAVAMTIPRGETRPYGWIARQAGRPRAVRAAASALAANPVPLLIPCHRIVQADGVAGGYVFGTPRKEALLRHEGANLDEVRDLAAAGTRYLASDTTGVVCFPSCRNARRITPAHRRGFASLAAAGRSGFRPCLHCQP
jgi:O-6-methylguanine DNA methyltransferase